MRTGARFRLPLSLLVLPLLAGCGDPGTPSASPSISRDDGRDDGVVDRTAILSPESAHAAADSTRDARADVDESVQELAGGSAASPDSTADSSADRAEPVVSMSDAADATAPATATDDGGENGAAQDHEYSTFDILAPTTVAPLILRLRIAVDGVPLEKVFAEELSQQRSRLDSDNDGIVSWQEMVTDDLVADILTGGQPDQRMMMQRGAAGRYDLNRNGIVEDDELQRALASGSAQYGPFDLDGRGMYRHRNREESSVLRAIDENRDARLDRDEMQAAGRALRTHDANADGVVRLDELAPPSNTGMTRRGSRAAAAFGEVAIELNDASDWSLIGDALRWWPGVEDGPFGNFTEGLDTNGDGWFYAGEALALQQRPPHVSATVDFTRGEAEDSWQARVSIDPSDSVCTGSAQCQQEGGRFVVRNPRLIWTLDLPTGLLEERANSREPLRLGQVRVTAGEQPDAFFEMLDTDDDGGLSGRELRQAAARLQQLDSNADEVVEAAEVPDSYQVSLQWRAAEPPPTPGRAIADGDAPAWARSLDLNRDGEIERAEFPGTDAQFQQLDVDGDGYATLAEAAQLDAEAVQGGGDEGAEGTEGA